MNVTDINMKKLNGSYLKNFHKFHLLDYLNILSSMAQKTHLSSQVEAWIQITSLKAYNNMIESSNFDKKMKGLAGALEICEENEGLLETKVMQKWIEDNQIV